jgi:hypothetical protein
MEKFKEILFNRIETQGADSLTVEFQRVREIKQVSMTQAEADILNAGRAESPGNTSFTLFLKDGDSDPEAIVHKIQKSGEATPIDSKGNLLSSGATVPASHLGKNRKNRA